MLLFKLFLAVILTEAITEIIIKSEIFSPMREKVFELGRHSIIFDWLHSLLDCGYCFSVWSGWLTAILVFRGINFIHWAVDWFFLGLIIHRLSNLFHNLMDRVHGEY